MSTPDMSTSDATAPDSPFARRLGSVVLDIVLVWVFAALGARTHHEGTLTFTDVGDVAVPFLVGVGLAHAFVRDAVAVRTGLVVWACVVVVGMIGRQVSGDGTALAFIVVATLFNLATLVGWRLVAAAVRSRRTH